MKALITPQNGQAYIVEVENDAQAFNIAADDFNATYTLDAYEIEEYIQHQAAVAAGMGAE